MSRAVESTREGGAQTARSELKHLTLEEEIFSLRTFAPASLSQLPDLFAESVVYSASRVLGEETGEALVRRIGDGKLTDPEQVYEALDSFLLGGSEELKRAIRLGFKSRVHRLYKLTLDLAS